MNDQPTRISSFGPFRLMEGARLLERNGEEVPLGSRAFDLLALLVERAGMVVSKRELLARGWPGLTVDETSLRVQIVGLRKALGDGREGARYISNVPGRGYCFVAAVVHHDPMNADLPNPSLEPLCRGAPRSSKQVVGRDDLVPQVEFLLHTYRFVTIHGPGGIGKTTVSKAVVGSSRDAFEGNVVFLDIGSIADLELIPSALAAALGLLVHDKDPHPQIIAALKAMRALIVFDGCEHAISEVTRLAELIHQESSGVSLLVTSREPLLAAGERVVQLPALAIPPRDRDLTLAQVLRFSAAELFVERAYAAGLSTELCEADIADLVEICNALDGIPLAIEIAASRAGRHGLSETARLLDRRLQLLWQGRRSAVQRHQTLHATLDWSYDLLDEDERSVLRWLSVFSARFTREAAEAVSLMDAVTTSQALDNLVLKSMVNIEIGGDVVRYRLLDTTRAYAHLRLQETSEDEAVRQRHIRYVIDQLAGVDLQRMTTDRGEPASGDDLLVEARAALAWSFNHEHAHGEAVRLVMHIVPILFRLKLVDECRRWLERALANIDMAGQGGLEEMRIEGAYGTALMMTQANSLRAQIAFERAISIAEKEADWRSAFEFNVRLQLLHRRTAEFERLHQLTDKAENYAELLDSDDARDGCRLLRGSAHSLCGDQFKAQEILCKAQRVQSDNPIEPGHFAYIGDARVPLALTLWLRGLPDQARKAAETIGDETGDVLFSCIAWSWAALAFHILGDNSRAAELTEKLRLVSNRHAMKPYQAVAVAFAAQQRLEEGDVNEAVFGLTAAVASLREARYGLYESIFSRSLALALLASDDVLGAQHIILTQLAKIEAMGGSYDHAEWLRIRAQLESRTGQRNAAARTLSQSIAVADQQGAMSWRLRSAVSFAKLLVAEKQCGQAIAELESALSGFTDGLGTRDLIEANALLDDLRRTGEI